MITRQLHHAVGHDPHSPPLGRSASFRPHKFDITRGGQNNLVSSGSFSRLDDQCYLSRNSLYKALRRRTDRATARPVET